jgi:hypothetical protein
VRQGEIRRRLDTTTSVPRYVLVLSGPSHLMADTGRVIACKVIPGSLPEDFAGVHAVAYTDQDGVSTIGIAVPELLDWYPRAALSQPAGVVQDMRPVLSLVQALFM